MCCCLRAEHKDPVSGIPFLALCRRCFDVRIIRIFTHICFSVDFEFEAEVCIIQQFRKSSCIVYFFRHYQALYLQFVGIGNLANRAADCPACGSVENFNAAACCYRSFVIRICSLGYCKCLTDTGFNNRSFAAFNLNQSVRSFSGFRVDRVISRITFSVYLHIEIKDVAAMNAVAIIYFFNSHISRILRICTGYNILFRICGNRSHSFGNMGSEPICLFFAHNIKLSVFESFDDCFLSMLKNDAALCIGVFIYDCAISSYQLIQSFIKSAFDNGGEIEVFIQICSRSVHDLLLNRETCQFRIAYSIGQLLRFI